MATSLFLTAGVTNGIGTFFDVATSAGASTSTGIVNTAASGTNIQWTRTAGGTVLEWISGGVPAAGWTFAGSATMKAWGLESANQANAGFRLRLYKRAFATGTITEITGSPWDKGTEFTTSNVAYSWTFTPTSTAFVENDRLVIRLFITNIGTMGGSQTCTVSYGNSTANSADSNLAITETVAFKSEGISPGVGASTGTGALAGVGASAFAAVGALTGGDSMAAHGAAAFTAVGALTGGDQMVGVGTGIVTGVGALAGTGSLAAVGASAFKVPGSPTGTGSLAGVGASAFAALGTLTGAGNLAGIGASSATAVGALSGTGVLAGIGVDTDTGVGMLTAGGALSGVGAVLFQGVGALTGMGALAGTGSGGGGIIVSGDGALGASGILMGVSAPVAGGGKSGVERLRQSTIAKIDRALAYNLVDSAAVRENLEELVRRLRLVDQPSSTAYAYDSIAQIPEAMLLRDSGWSMTEIYALVDDVVAEREDEEALLMLLRSQL